MINSVLFVDDEMNILKALKRLFVDQDIEVITTQSPYDAVNILNSTNIPVVVSDNPMPGMNGIDFLAKVKVISPDSVKIMMTAHADLDVAMDAINKGEVYKFIVKPWNNEELKHIIFDALNRFNIIQSLKNADEGTLLSLAQAIELKDPYTRGHCERVAFYALTIAAQLNLSEDDKRNIKFGSYLHDCGKIGVPEDILNSPDPLTDDQMEIIKKHPLWGADVVRPVKLHKTVMNIILYHHEKCDGSGYPTGLKGEEIPIEARVVAVADVYDALTSDRPYRKQMTPSEAMQVIVKGEGHHFDPAIAEILIRSLSEEVHGTDKP